MLFLHHSTHSAHSTHTRRHSTTGRRILFRNLGNHTLGSQQHAGNRSGILQCGSGNLGGINNTSSNKVFILLGGGIETHCSFESLYMLNDYRTFTSGIIGDLTNRFFKSSEQNISAKRLLTFYVKCGKCFEASEISNATTRNNAFFDSSTGCVQCIFNSRLLLFHLNLSCSTNIDDSNTANQFGKSLLQFLTIIVRSGILNLGTDLLDTSGKLLFITGAVNKRGVVFIDDNALTGAEVIDGDIFKFDAEIFGDNLTTGENGDILEHRLATITKTRSFNGSHTEGAAQAY